MPGMAKFMLLFTGQCIKSLKFTSLVPHVKCENLPKSFDTKITTLEIGHETCKNQVVEVICKIFPGQVLHCSSWWLKMIQPGTSNIHLFSWLAINWMIFTNSLHRKLLEITKHPSILKWLAFGYQEYQNRQIFNLWCLLKMNPNFEPQSYICFNWWNHPGYVAVHIVLDLCQPIIRFGYCSVGYVEIIVTDDPK